jgi:hypothetical protein
LEPSRSWTPLSHEDHRAIERENQPWYVDRHVEAALRGYKLAQEVVNRHKSHALACAAYATELEWFVAEEGSFVIPPHLAFSRWMALGHDIDGKVLYRLKFNDIERTT